MTATRALVVTVVHDPEDARIRHRQIPALLRAGWQVTYAAPFTAYGRRPPPGVLGIDLPRAHGRRRVAALRAARALVQRRTPDHDVVLLHDPELLLVAGRRVRLTARVVWDVHEDTAAALALKDWLPAPVRPVVAAAVRRAESWAESRVAILLAEHGYRSRFREDHPVVPNSVLVPTAEPGPPGEERVVYIGRLNAARGARELVALGQALRGRVAVELVGNADEDVAGGLRAAHDAGDVIWHGFLPNDAALARLPGALAGLSLLHDQPNYAHSQPTKVMEYMAYGVPVVTTANQASAELVKRFACGVVVPFGDVPAAERAVEALRSDPVERRRAGAAGRAAAVSTLSWWNDADAFVTALQGACPSPDGSSSC